jgi:hypothetical protein
MTIDGGSFRDPDGRVFFHEGRVLRGMTEASASALSDAGSASVLTDRVVEHWRVSDVEVPPEMPREAVIEARRLPLVSYPSEWSFTMLKDAGLLTLDLASECIRAGFDLKDGSAFNVSFEGCHPLWIDLGSIERRVPGVWLTYGQFCDHFLNPLLIESILGIPFQPLLRASLEGVPVTWTAAMLHGKRSMRRSVLTHVKLRNRMERIGLNLETTDRKALRQSAHLPEAAVLRTIQQLRLLIESLESSTSTDWVGYESTNSYEQRHRELKMQFVDQVARTSGGLIAWDIGANTGIYSEILAAHVPLVLALDSDSAAVDVMYRRLRDTPSGNRIVPLVVDISDPPSNRGWRLEERLSLSQRSNPDLACWLAIIHHLCLGREIPLAEFLRAVAETSRHALVEFVAPEDPMAQKLTATRPRGRHEYSLALFERLLPKWFQVVHRQPLGDWRHLFHRVRA